MQFSSVKNFGVGLMFYFFLMQNLHFVGHAHSLLRNYIRRIGHVLDVSTRTFKHIFGNRSFMV